MFLLTCSQLVDKLKGNSTTGNAPIIKVISTRGFSVPFLSEFRMLELLKAEQPITNTYIYSLEAEQQHIAVLISALVTKKHKRPCWTDSSRFTTVPGIQTSPRVVAKDVVCSKFSESPRANGRLPF